MIPFITLFGEKLFLYPFMMGAAWGVGYHISKSLNQKYHVFKNFNWIFLGIFISSWLGSKLFYLLSVDTNAKTSIAQNTNFWLGGGFVFYGGLIGGIIFIALMTWKFKVDIGDFSIFIPSILLGHAIGRIGCFLAGCCYGVELEHEYFFSHYLHGAERFPVQLLEAIALVIGGWDFLRRVQIRSFEYVMNYFFFYALVRFMTELWRGDSFRGIWFDLISTSQIIAAVFVFVFLFWKVKTLNKISNR